MDIEIGKITVDVEIVGRVDGLDFVTIQSYADDMEAGAVFPPVELVGDGDVFWLVDGLHRLEAAKKINREQISSNVTEGDERVGVVGQWLRRPRPGGTRRAAQPADPGVGSAGRGAVHRPAGGRCAQPAAGTPARPLNSSIMASHVGAMVWTWRQKSCPRRTSKSAKSIPRCSTHV